MKSLRSKHLAIHFTESEYEKVLELFQKSTCRSLSEFGCRVLLRGPVQIRYRNESLDSTMEELVGLRMDLKDVLSHLESINRTQCQINDSVNQSPPIASIIDQELRPSIANIMQRIANFSDIWSQYSKTEKASPKP